MIVPYVPPQTPSPRAQELGQRVALTIAAFQQKYPDLSEEEVRQALALASDRSPDRARSARTAVITAAGGAVVPAGLAAYAVGERFPQLNGAALPAIVAGVVAVVAVVVARRRRE